MPFFFLMVVPTLFTSLGFIFGMLFANFAPTMESKTVVIAVFALTWLYFGIRIGLRAFRRHMRQTSAEVHAVAVDADSGLNIN